MPPIEIVVDGTDSGGKTPCVEALRVAFAARLNVQTCAPFRIQEVYHLWEREPQRAAATIRSIMEGFRRENGASDMIIWDRGWPTVWVSTTDTIARKSMLPFPALTLLLLNFVEVTKSKAEKYGLPAIWLNDPVLLRRYHDAYHELPREVCDDSVAAFFPNSEGRFDYSVITRYATERLNTRAEKMSNQSGPS